MCTITDALLSRNFSEVVPLSDYRNQFAIRPYENMELRHLDLFLRRIEEIHLETRLPHILGETVPGQATPDVGQRGMITRSELCGFHHIIHVTTGDTLDAGGYLIMTIIDYVSGASPGPVRTAMTAARPTAPVPKIAMLVPSRVPTNSS
jgi:hypothetical protein